MQFAAIVMMVMMCSALMFLMPNRVRRDKVINRSRLLMIILRSCLFADEPDDTEFATTGTAHTFRTIDVDRCHAGGDSLLGYISSC